MMFPEMSDVDLHYMVRIQSMQYIIGILEMMILCA